MYRMKPTFFRLLSPLLLLGFPALAMCWTDQVSGHDSIFLCWSSLACWKLSHTIDSSLCTTTAKTNLHFTCYASVIIALDRDGGWSIRKPNSWRLRFMIND